MQPELWDIQLPPSLQKLEPGSTPRRDLVHTSSSLAKPPLVSQAVTYRYVCSSGPEVDN